MTTAVTLYEDRCGPAPTVLHNDGRTLRMSIRGVTFCGTDFDALAPEPETSAPLLAPFVLNQGSLCACTLRVRIRLPLMLAGVASAGELEATIALGEPGPRGGLTHESVRLCLRSPSGELHSRGATGWFEDELLELQAQLPPGDYLLACIACAYSDYFPGGHGCFGALACFRGAKDGYAAVRTKHDLLRLWELRSELVQETFRCGEFERRRPGTGYRG